MNINTVAYCVISEELKVFLYQDHSCSEKPYQLKVPAGRAVYRSKMTYINQSHRDETSHLLGMYRTAGTFSFF